ncbi:MAG TPA: hypothetical protein VGL93_16720 [Streptosporangiaceae bacterium]|jgi:Mce-associated membrane protein
MRAQSDENTTPTPAEETPPEDEDAVVDEEADAVVDPEDEADDEDDEDAEDGEPEDGEDERGPSALAALGGRVFARPLLAAAIALVVVAAGCAVYFGGAWYTAAHDESLRYSQMRDSALVSGEQAVQNLNTLDYRHVDQGLNLWLQSSAGDLRNSITAGRKTFAAQVQQAKTATTAKVLDAAITQLDEHAGKAAIIVALEITVTPAKGKPATKQSRLQGELTRTGAGWKLSKIGQVAVDTGAGGAPLATPAPRAS